MNLLKSILVVTLLAVGLAGVLWANIQGQTAVSAAASTGTEETAVDQPAGEGPITPQLVATGFNNPVDIANAGDDRLFIVERAGIIKIIDTDGTVRPTPFLNMSSIVNSSPNERGLLGLAFHPDYPNTPYFYVNYTTTAIDGHSSGDTVVSRYTVSSDPYIANPTSRQEVIHIAQPDWNHNGGDLNFGPDGYLYMGMGDGGGGGDTWNNAQNPTVLLGKMLRIDVDGNGLAPDCDSNGNYTIPADNPFIDGAGGDCDEIWALGVRNPWRFSFDRETGDMYIGDVGQGNWEEVNFQPASVGGKNWGWRCYEGTHPYNMSGCTGTYEDPFFEYSHSQGVAITGGYVYRGDNYPALDGHYIFADYASGRFWLANNDGTEWNVQGLGTLPGPNTPSTFGEGCNGEIYVAHYSSSNGAIYHIQSNVQRGKLLGEGGDSYVYLPVIMGGEGDAATPTPMPTITTTVTVEPTASVTTTATVEPTVTVEPTASATNTPAATATASPTNTAVPTMVPTTTPTPSSTPTGNPPLTCSG